MSKHTSNVSCSLRHKILVQPDFFDKTPKSIVRSVNLERKHAKQRMLEQNKYLHRKLASIDAETEKL